MRRFACRQYSVYDHNTKKHTRFTVMHARFVPFKSIYDMPFFKKRKIRC